MKNLINHIKVITGLGIVAIMIATAIGKPMQSSKIDANETTTKNDIYLIDGDTISSKRLSAPIDSQNPVKGN